MILHKSMLEKIGICTTKNTLYKGLVHELFYSITKIILIINLHKFII